MIAGFVMGLFVGLAFGFQYAVALIDEKEDGEE